MASSWRTFRRADGTFNNVLFQQSPSLNSYMFNLIAVAPFGNAHSYDPYISRRHRSG